MEFFLNKERKRPSHENERKIAPKTIVPEPPVVKLISMLNPMDQQLIWSLLIFI